MTALFPPQRRDWQLPVEAPLTTKAFERVCRECAEKAFGRAARNIGIDWGVKYYGTQMRRWSQKAGGRMLLERNQETTAMESGTPPAPNSPETVPELLVLGVDGGTVQTTEKNAETGSRWKGSKIATVTSYVPGDGAEKKPAKLVTTHVSSMGGPDDIGPLLRCEAERRNVLMAVVVLVIADCGNWIDPLFDKHFAGRITQRIADWFHAVEHLANSARAATAGDPSGYQRLYNQWEKWLWNGKLDRLLQALRAASEKAGKPEKNDAPNLPRVVLHRDVGYFENNRQSMNYPEYRAKGWPIGSGNIEAGVKQFNKRVKGTDQFWDVPHVEEIMALREKWISEDGRWETYWAGRPAYLKRSA